MNEKGISIVSLIIAILALVIAVGMPLVMPAPEGEIGPEGPQGPAGADGADGADGTDGADGMDGIACWDLNGNGTGDLPDEDINGDGVVNVTDCTGPEGPEGPQGLQGDPGPGTTMANASSGGLQRILDICTHFSGGEVTITVDGPGMVVVSATLVFEIEHTVGDQDVLRAYIGQSDADCTMDDHMVYQGVDAAEPTQTFISTIYLHKPFAVAGAGTYTYYLNAEMAVGALTWDNFATVSMIVVFYPS